MTPEERAEKLTPLGQPHHVDSPDGLRIFREAIAAQIRAAVEEARAAALERWTNELVKLGRAEAYEEAAKHFEGLSTSRLSKEMIVAKIRALSRRAAKVQE